MRLSFFLGEGERWGDWMRKDCNFLVTFCSRSPLCHQILSLFDLVTFYAMIISHNRWNFNDSVHLHI